MLCLTIFLIFYTITSIYVSKMQLFAAGVFMKNIRAIFCFVFSFSSLFSMEPQEQSRKKVTKQSILLVMQEVLQTGSLITLDEHKKKLESYLLLTKREDALAFIQEQIGLLQVKMKQEEFLIEKQLQENSLDGSFELLQEQEEQEEDWDLISVEKE
jgi:hypothetical protein